MNNNEKQNNKTTKSQDLEKLKKIDTKVIVAKTYLSHDSIKAIFDEDFKYFKDPVKLKRLIRFLEQSYDVNLKDWEDKYDEYKSINSSVAQKKEKEIFDYMPILNVENTKYKNKSRVVLFALGLVVLIVLYFLFDALSKDNSFLLKSDEVESNILKSEEILSSANETIKYKVDKKTLTVVPLEKSRHKRKLINEKEDIFDELNPERDEILDMNIIIDLNQSILEVVDYNISITTNLGRVWIGIVDADTYDRKSYIIEGTREYNVFDNTIIITGHGHLTIRSQENEYNTKTGEKQYFYYKDNSFVKLKRLEYLYLNKGIEW